MRWLFFLRSREELEQEVRRRNNINKTDARGFRRLLGKAKRGTPKRRALTKTKRAQPRIVRKRKLKLKLRRKKY